MTDILWHLEGDGFVIDCVRYPPDEVRTRVRSETYSDQYWGDLKDAMTQAFPSFEACKEVMRQASVDQFLQAKRYSIWGHGPKGESYLHGGFSLSYHQSTTLCIGKHGMQTIKLDGDHRKALCAARTPEEALAIAEALYADATRMG